jgi:hypothetical protein
MTPAVLISLPDASSTLSTAATFSVPLFVTLIGLAAALIGIVIGGLFVRAIARTTLSAVKTGMGAKKGGGKRRRR